MPDLTPAGLKRRDQRLRRLYGISLDTYHELYRLQGGVCAICSRPETLRIKGVLQPLSVEHSHVTKRVRGLACNDCNTAIGKVKEDVRTLRRMIAYLQGRLTSDIN